MKNLVTTFLVLILLTSNVLADACNDALARLGWPCCDRGQCTAYIDQMLVRTGNPMRPFRGFAGTWYDQVKNSPTYQAAGWKPITMPEFSCIVVFKSHVAWCHVVGYNSVTCLQQITIGEYNWGLLVTGTPSECWITSGYGQTSVRTLPMPNSNVVGFIRPPRQPLACYTPLPSIR